MPKIYATGDNVLASEFNEVVKTSGLYTADSQASDAYVLTMTPSPGTYAHGDVYRFRANTANTGAATVNINSLGAKTIKKNVNEDLLTGDILAGQMVEIQYDGTNFQMISSKMPRPLYATGQGTRTVVEGAGNETIAHGLGTTPGLIKISFFFARTVNNALGYGVGTATSTSDETCTYFVDKNDINWVVGQNATNIIHTEMSTGSVAWEATLSTLDATNIVLNFGTADSSNDLLYQWEAFA